MTHRNHKSRAAASLLFGALVSCCAASELRAADKLPSVNFNRDIRPILTSKCFACHGPDAGSRQAELRLDREQDAHAKRDGSPAIAPGSPRKSELFSRITSRDADLQMPPKETGKTLSPREIELIRRWIVEGAKYTRHWAFIKPRLPKPPAVINAEWTRNEIDRFILAEIERAQFRRSRQADNFTLLRRVSLDLIGLPPTSKQMAAFRTDVRELSFDKAYEKQVDRLLKSPRYGERWARRWLDLARYADTNGYEKDRTRSIWAYRDWVIAALNRDMPFDQFTIEQLAGDLLPDATLSQKIATGFHRNTMLNEEGGIDPLEFRFHAMVDRVSTTGTTWLGLTIGCAQCHSHKYDPISHHDYYRLMAFLNNADEPEQDLPDAALVARHRAGLKRAQQLLAALPSKWPTGKTNIADRFGAWLKRERQRTVRWQTLRPVQMTSNLPLLTVQKDDSVFASGDTAKVDVYELEFQPLRPGITAILLEAMPDDRLPEHGPGSTYYEGTRGDFFLGEFQTSADGKPLKIATATHSYARNRYGTNPVSARLATDNDPQTGWSVHGRQGERHTAVFVLKQPLGDVKSLTVKMLFGRHFASSLGRFRISVTTAKNEPVARDFPLDIERLLAIPDRRLSKIERQRLYETFLLTTPELVKHAKQILTLRKRPDFPTTLVMRERPANHPRPTFLHKRGEFLQPSIAVKANVPEVLHAFPKTARRNRLGLAIWLVSAENPLTARVVVNRHWAAFFGTGIVETLDDFGLQGSRPSHPKLLDWLAVQLMTPSDRGGMGWSIKRLHKRIVMSATYRQSSLVQKKTLERDPSNRLLSYAPRIRVEAEVLRDSVLQAAGLLSTTMGGPGVRPPQPRGVTEVAYGGQKWVASTGENRHRRSVYTFIKRTAPFAMYRTFDASSGESCIARRDRSNTPLQALTLLNDVMFTEAAQAMGRHLADVKQDDAKTVIHAFRRVLSRNPSLEFKMLLDFVDTQRARFKTNQLDPVKIAGQKENAVEVAVWTSVARVLFGLDETVTRN
jgi:mono/diheme cytochrome c family protein